MARLSRPQRRAARDEEFRETLAQPMATPRSYRADTTTDLIVSPAEQIIRAVAGVLNLLLALRFVTALFSTDTTNGWVSFIIGLTDWLVTPFENLFNMVPNGTSFFDLPALAAIVVVSLIAWAINGIIRSSRGDIQ
jgi:uncharacterized protein YggT (Ycf19 family)